MLEGPKKLTKRGVNVLLIAALTVSLIAMLAIFSCTADSSEAGKSAATGTSASSTAAPVAAASTPRATPPPRGPLRPIPPVKSYPPDMRNYSIPVR